MHLQTSSSTNGDKLRWFRPRRDRAKYVGIDIGVDRVRVATFGVPNQGTRSLRWVSQSEFALPIDVEEAPDPSWVDVVAHELRERLPRCVDGDLCNAVVALPSSWIHYQTTSTADLEATKSQCDSIFSQSIFQSPAHSVDWPIVVGKDQMMVAATAEHAACEIARSISSVGYRVNGIMPHGLSLLHNAAALTMIKPSAVLLLEFTGSLIAFSDGTGRCGLCRNLPACHLPLSSSPFADEMEPWLQDIANEIKATTRFVRRLGNQRDNATPVLICGSAASVPGVDEMLASLLGQPVATWRYAGRMRPRNRSVEESAHANDSELALSLSLACMASQTGRSVSS